MKKLKGKRLKKFKKAADKAPAWVRNGVIAHYDPPALKKFKDKQLGKMGAASEVRHIDPDDYIKT